VRDDRNSNRRLTVAHFMPWSGIGGTEIATLRLTDATKRQFRHVAFCPHGAVALGDSFEESGIETVSYAPPEPSFLRHAGKFYKDSVVVARQLRKIGADIVHFADELAAYHNSFAAFLAHTRTVCHLRNSYPDLPLRERLCLLPVQSFVFVSKEAKRNFALSLPDRKTRVIYDAVEVSTADTSESNAAIRDELEIPPGCTLVGMVARVAPQKDYFTLASAAAGILSKYADTRFLVVGDKSLVNYRRHHEEIVRKLDELGIADKFIFTGHRNDVSRLIAAMDICVLCTHQEGFPLSILESMAKRKPVVATAVGGIPEIVKTGVTGILHQHGDSNELAGAIMSLIEDPEMANRLAQAAFENVQQNFSRQIFADEISNAYSDVMRQ
jgi:glycosyltransferase involved in cell wall biosynthesis